MLAQCLIWFLTSGNLQSNNSCTKLKLWNRLNLSKLLKERDSFGQVHDIILATIERTIGDFFVSFMIRYLPLISTPDSLQFFLLGLTVQEHLGHGALSQHWQRDPVHLEQVFGHEVQEADFGLGHVKVALASDPNGVDPFLALAVAPGEGVHGDPVGVALLAGAAVGNAAPGSGGRHLVQAQYEQVPTDTELRFDQTLKSRQFVFVIVLLLLLLHASAQ